MTDTMIVPLPGDVTGLLGGLVDGDGFLAGVHPGLTLDKYALSWDASGVTKGLSERVQRPAVDQVVRLSHAAPPGLDYAALFARWEATLGAKGNAFTGTTAGPLTLHLARASALENAGICLHRIYGFTFLPGTGLKGLARAFAETVWLDSLPDAEKAAGWRKIEAVFGWAPGSDLIDGKSKAWKPADALPPAVSATAGSVIFHDAWPEKWPRLVTDILNSHHPKYYQDGQPPGDWEDPIPVYFLSVEPGTKFRFAVAPRRSDADPELAKLARAWLIGGLTQLGAGAKTASGYGDFTVDEPKVAPVISAKRPGFTATLELVTPAFLAGAKQQQEDCDLRPSTLRGQLRWWWRTMHAGFVTTEQLKAMEAAIWGDTKTGGAVRVTVRPNGPVPTLEYDRKSIIMQQRLPQPPDRKTSQGLIYHSYGMDDGGKPRRFFVPPGTGWTATVAARARREELERDPKWPDRLLGQARAALTLLCQYGGVGAKARKGFGSFADQPGGVNLIGLKAEAAGFRTAFGIPPAKYNPRLAESPSLEQMLSIPEIPSGGANPWLALDQLAASAQAFAKKYKHRAEKKALGLPRRIGSPVSGMFRAGPHVKERHASPGLYHLARAADGNLVARAVAFPAAELPNLADSTTFLRELLDHIGGDLPGRFGQYVAGSKGPAAPAATRPAGGPPRPAGPALSNGQRVKAKIVDDPRGKGRAFAEVQGLVGNILNPPSGRTLAAGEEVDLVINSVNVAMKQIAFRWPA